MDTTQILSILTALFSAAAAILAWIAKLRWSDEYQMAKEAEIRAKDAVIQAKDAQIEGLQREIDNMHDLTPMKIREYFESVKIQLEEYNEYLKKKLNVAVEDLQIKDDLITKLQKQKRDLEKLQSLSLQKEDIVTQIKLLKKQIQELTAARNYAIHGITNTDQLLNPTSFSIDIRTLINKTSVSSSSDIVLPKISEDNQEGFIFPPKEAK